MLTLCLASLFLNLLTDDQSDIAESDILTCPPRLYLVLTENATRTNLGGDRRFEETLNGLTTSRRLPAPETTLFPPPEILHSLQSDQGAEEWIPADGEIIFPSLFDVSDTPPASLPSTAPAPLVVEKGDQDGQEGLRIKVPAGRAYPVPEVLSLSGMHESIPAWRDTLVPPCVPCMKQVEQQYHDRHDFCPHQEEQNDQDLDVPSLSSPTSSVTTVIDAQLVTPVIPEAMESLCVHVRELSSDTVVTDAASIQANDALQLQQGRKDLDQELKMPIKVDAGHLGLGIQGQESQQGRKDSHPPASSDDTECKVPAYSATVETRTEQPQANMETGGSPPLDPPKSDRSTPIRDKPMLVVANKGTSAKSRRKTSRKRLYAGSAQSLFRGPIRRLPEQGIVSANLSFVYFNYATFLEYDVWPYAILSP